jgi:plasmid maintenance system antidote protein VapI
MSEKQDSAFELRAAIGGARVPIYKLAAAINLHPSRLSAVLNEHVPLTSDLAQRIRTALDQAGRVR